MQNTNLNIRNIIQELSFFLNKKNGMGALNWIEAQRNSELTSLASMLIAAIDLCNNNCFKNLNTKNRVRCSCSGNVDLDLNETIHSQDKKEKIIKLLSNKLKLNNLSFKLNNMPEPIECSTTHEEYKELEKILESYNNCTAECFKDLESKYYVLCNCVTEPFIIELKNITA